MKKYSRPLYLARWMDRFQCPLPVKINTYSGCHYQCNYCFAANMRKNTNKAHQRDHEKVIPADLKKIEEHLEGISNPRKHSALYMCLKKKLPIQIGPLSDPFQPIERKHKITEKTVELLRDHDYPFMILTKGGNQLRKMAPLLGECKAVVHVSIGTEDHGARALFEPKTPTIKARLKSIRACTDEGVTVQHRLWPIIPLYDNYYDLQRLIEKTVDAGCKDVVAAYLRVLSYKTFKHSVGQDYLDRLGRARVPYVKEFDYYRIQSRTTESTFRGLKGICDDLGVGFYNPTILHFNEGKCCCGTDDYLGPGAPWALQLNHQRIQQDTTFEEYMDGFDCPYSDRFQRFWDKGGLIKAFFDVRFDELKKTYSRKWL